MSTQGILLIDLIGLALMLLIFHLVRTHKLYAGYAVVWLGTILCVIVAVSYPPLLNLVTRAVGAIYPASALSLLAFAFIFCILVFFSVKLSTLSARQVEMAQRYALYMFSREQGQDHDQTNPLRPPYGSP